MIEFEAVEKRFGQAKALDGFDLTVPEGAVLGLIGPNGAGKTTFVNLLTGIVTPDSGMILLNGRPIQKEKPEARVRRGLARTHQINTLLLETPVRDNVAIAIAEREKFAWRMFRYLPQWRKCLEEADERLAEMGIADIGRQEVRHLPYGEQRLLEIAIAMALKPQVLLLDEPGAGVPSNEAHVIHDALDRLPQDIAILLIEHDMDLVFKFAKEIVVLVQGAVLTRGKPDAIAADPEVRAVYLGRSRD